VNAGAPHAMEAGHGHSPSFVVFSDDWGEHMSSSQHIFKYIARQHPVVWVNTIGMRNPTIALGDLRKAYRKVSRMLSRPPARAQPVNDEVPVKVCQPLMLPFGRVGALRAFNIRSVTRAVLGVTGRRDLSGQIVVTTVPNVGDYDGLLRGATVVYYCVDDFTQWPGLDASLVREMEQRLIARADAIVATSSKLYDRLAAFGKPTHLLTHGVDLELFSREESVAHQHLLGIPKPRAGFFGLIDARMDQELVASLAKRMPDWSFVLAGPVEVATEGLSKLDNVHFTGPIPYRELPSLIAGLDVLMIPYAPGEFADTLSPLKLKEYLATGKCVVSTPIAEARARASHVTTAGTVDEWISALRGSLMIDVAKRRGSIFPALESETWAAKAGALLRICMQAGLNAQHSELRFTAGGSADFIRSTGG
jgi:glycosyltransferase involved in cell wall biosynthesis